MKIQFTYDPKKAASNLRKHGISFEEATTVFADPLSGTWPDEEHSREEERWIIVGKSSVQRLLFVVYTEAEFTIRLIGARTATAQERKDYEEN